MRVREAVERIPEHIRNAPTILAAGDIAALFHSHQRLEAALRPVLEISDRNHPAWNEAWAALRELDDLRALSLAVEDAGR